MAKHNPNCIWNCGRETRNKSRICDQCWEDREAIYQARKAREAVKGRSPNRAEAGRRTAAAARLGRHSSNIEEQP